MARKEFTIAQKIAMGFRTVPSLFLLRIISLFCPYEKIYPLSKKIGKMLLGLFPDKKNIIKKNLSIIFPEKKYSEQELDEMYAIINGYEVRILLEMMAFVKMNFQKLISHIRISQHDQLSKMYHEQHNSFISCTLHYGNWELLGFFLDQMKIPVSCIAERIYNPWINKFLLALRKKAGMKIVYNEISRMRPLLSSVRKKEGGIVLLADQQYWFNPLFIPFFNKEASIPQGPAGLALKLKTNLFLMYTRLVENGIYTINMDAGFNLVKNRDIFLDKEELMKTIYLKYEEIIRYDVSNWWILGLDRWGLTRESLKEWQKNPDCTPF